MQARPAPPPVFILAGGASRRMGGGDKGLALLGGRRLVDLVIERLRAQTPTLAICGPGDYGTGQPFVPDRGDGPRGPAAGLWAAARWLEASAPDARGFCTAPVDAPFVPGDLVARLTSGEGSAVAFDGVRLHPTFAYWDLAALRGVLDRAGRGEGIALHDIAGDCGASRVDFPAQALLNVNTPEDLARAGALLAQG